MSGPRTPRKKLLEEENLLRDLNLIADFVIGNQSPEDASFKERDTLPEALSFAITYPNSDSAIETAMKKVKDLSLMVADLYNKLRFMQAKNELKDKKF